MAIDFENNWEKLPVYGELPAIISKPLFILLLICGCFFLTALVEEYFCTFENVELFNNLISPPVDELFRFLAIIAGTPYSFTAAYAVFELIMCAILGSGGHSVINWVHS